LSAGNSQTNAVRWLRFQADPTRRAHRRGSFGKIFEQNLLVGRFFDKVV